MIDEGALKVQMERPEIMAGQIRHLLALADAPHATVRVIPWGALMWETRGNNFDVLSFAGTDDRIGVMRHILGADLASGDQAHEIWSDIGNRAATGMTQSKAILERHLAALS